MLNLINNIYENNRTNSNCTTDMYDKKLYYKQISIIKELLRKIGIPVNLIGHEYIVEALICMINSKRILFLKEAYAMVSKIKNTSELNVEASIRNAIRKALKKNESKVKEILNVSDKVKISNSVFLNIIKEYVFKEMIKND